MGKGIERVRGGGAEWEEARTKVERGKGEEERDKVIYVKRNMGESVNREKGGI